MKHTIRKILIVLMVLLTCGLLATGGWILYDMNVDRSGFLLENGIYYYQDFHARLVTGWQDIEGNRYYFGDDYAMATYWQDIDGNRYYFSGDGTMDTGWCQWEDRFYYLGDDGIMLSGWQDIDGNRYHFDTDGSMDTGWTELEGQQYHFGTQGVMTQGFFIEDSRTYFFQTDGTMATGYLTIDDGTYYFNDNGTLHTGWLTEEEGKRYFQANGTLVTGWQELENETYYFGDTGYMHTGWLQLGEYDYYLLEDGTTASGPVDIDGTTYYFTPAGIHVVLVNRSHKVPEYYEVNLVTFTGYHQVSDVCLEPLQRMLDDCVAAGNKYTFNSAYRTLGTQQGILDSRTKEHMEAYGLDYGAARAKALQTVAIPGTSEHHLGLAVDIVGKSAQDWLAEHCWEYGFILRYTEEKQSITGFVDEPWHFRYVGTEVSLDMKDSGLCLEEYLGAA